MLTLLLCEAAFVAVMRISPLRIHLHPADHSLELAGRGFVVGVDSIHAEGPAESNICGSCVRGSTVKRCHSVLYF
jgi:hypothetical protein